MEELPEDSEIVSKVDEILSAIEKLKEVTISELNFLENENLDEKEIVVFREKKTEFRSLIENHLKKIELMSDDRILIKNQFEEILNMEKKIGLLYRERLQLIEDGLYYINTERKLRETYAKGGMSFLTNEDKNLK